MEVFAGLGMIAGLVWLAVIVLVIASFWVVFTKAGHPGWACIVPIYNIIILLQIARKPLWWIILMLIPLVNIVIGILVVIEIAKNFGKSSGFGIGLLVLPFIFYPILAWGDARYQPQT
jgi:hypothetical protein